MADIEVSDADNYERVWKISLNTPTAEVFEFLSQKTGVSSELLMILTNEGVSIDRYLSLSQQIEPGQKIFLVSLNN